MQHQFGPFGGQYVPEEAITQLNQIEKIFKKAIQDPSFIKQLTYYQRNYIGRPSPLYYAENLSQQLGGSKIYLKREDLNHTGSHKINNAIGQMLLAKRLGKQRIIAETGAGQHGVATATAAALFGLPCDIFMGAEDMARQRLNVFRMETLGATLHPVHNGSQCLAEAVDAAINHWVTHLDTSFYLMGSAVGPHPYPTIVKYFQQIISQEALTQLEQAEHRLPDYCIACVGGGSNAIGAFAAFIPHDNVQLIGVEAAGKGIASGQHAASLTTGKAGIIHGMHTYYLQTPTGDIQTAHSISAGLDYPGVGPEHAYLKKTGRADYPSVTDQEALDAFLLTSRSEGIIPALESSHALAYAIKLAPQLTTDSLILVNVSGRGDKDVETVETLLTQK